MLIREGLVPALVIAPDQVGLKFFEIKISILTTKPVLILIMWRREGLVPALALALDHVGV